MSRMALEMQRIADELKKTRARKPEGRKVTTTPKPEGEKMDGPESKPVDAGEEATPPVAQDPLTEVAAPVEGEAMATAASRSSKTRGRKAKKSATKRRGTAGPARRRSVKTAAAPAEKASATAFPANAASAKLAEDGVRIEERNRYVNLYFEGGLVVRLQPANLGQEDTIKARDFVAKFLKANLK
jgi:hypothetical protein